MRLALLCATAAVIGCRASVERGQPPQTIVVREAPDGGPVDAGERAPNRIEVVVADPLAAGAQAPVLAQLVGRSVKVQFRRDALGVAAPAPISPTGQGPGGRIVHLTGTVRSAMDGWLVLERDGNTCWVPHSAILLIEVPDPPTTSPARE